MHEYYNWDNIKDTIKRILASKGISLKELKETGFADFHSIDEEVRCKEYKFNEINFMIVVKKDRYNVGKYLYGFFKSNDSSISEFVNMDGYKAGVHSFVEFGNAGFPVCPGDFTLEDDK